VERQKSDMFTLNAQQGSWVIKLCQFCGLIESAFRLSCGFWCMNDKMIKELMNFAKCETEKMSCDYVEAIYSSRHML
jgi:hypothetical protein